MAHQLILEFAGVTPAQYWAVNKVLGMDMRTGEGDIPDGLRTHLAGLSADGALVVTEVWDSVADQERFMHERLGAALGQSGITGPPSSVRWLELIARQNF